MSAVSHARISPVSPPRHGMVAPRAPVRLVLDGAELVIPPSVVDLASLRDWLEEDGFPEKLRAFYLQGEVWLDVSREQVFTHVGLKTEYTAVLAGITKDVGYYLTDGVLITNVAADLSGNPDGTFVSHASLLSGKARLVEGKRGGFTELEGSPDMVLEIMGDSSVHKDTVQLKRMYAEAGIDEYWLVDARRGKLDFTIYRRSPRGYVRVRSHQDWVRSVVFNKAFKLSRRTDRLGNPVFTLESR